jgi:hypothetical protein
MASYNPVAIVGTSALAAGPLTVLSPGDTLLAGHLLDTSIARPGIPAWAAGLAVAIGQVYSYSGLLYQVVQAHTTQSTWTPLLAHSLWTPYRPPGTVAPWVQPLGSFDAYPLGWQVTYGGYTWQSLVAANVWAPGTGTLWLNLTPPPPTNNWAAGVAYKVGDIVIYVPNGLKYQCLQAHTSQAGWNPPAVPALWKAI